MQSLNNTAFGAVVFSLWIVGLLLNGVAVLVLWNAFLVSGFGFSPLSVHTAIGIVLIVLFLAETMGLGHRSISIRLRKATLSDPSYRESVVWRTGYWIIAPIILTMIALWIDTIIRIVDSVT